jgi:hypothetical protein
VVGDYVVGNFYDGIGKDRAHIQTKQAIIYLFLVTLG